jgi:outer membrane protein OmpA-like peptidoglycan-associated protein
MRDRIFLAVLLSAALALPALAQQTNSTSSQQPAATDQKTTSPSQSSTASQKQPRDSHTDFWEGDQPSAAALIFHPFASKGYVRRHTEPIRDRLNELEQMNSSNSTMAKDVDTRAQHGIQLVSEKTNEGDQHASEASNKSQLAQQTASAVNTRLPKVETVVDGLDQYKAGGAQTVIQYRPGQTVLSKAAKQSLDEMATQLKDQRGYVVEVHGYSSGTGQAAIASSRRMADAVLRYLVLNHEIPAYRIYAMGMGNAPATAEEASTGKRSSRNRVEVSVLKNSVDQLASTSSSGASAPPK